MLLLLFSFVLIDVSADSRCSSIGTSYLAFVNDGNLCGFVPEKYCLYNQLEDFHDGGNSFANALGNVQVVRESSM